MPYTSVIATNPVNNMKLDEILGAVVAVLFAVSMVALMLESFDVLVK
jgi:hypothetical protein